MAEAKQHILTDEIKFVAKQENVEPELIMRGIANGRIIIPRNIKHNINPIGIGEGLRIKINANIGTSTDIIDIDLELRKAELSEKYGADTLMDLSTGGDLDEIRRKILEAIKIPLGTVPIYQVAIETVANKKAIVDMSPDLMFNIIEKQAKDGVDFMTLHCGVVKNIMEHLKEHPRLMPMVSRGGTFLGAWILHNNEENPLYSDFDYLLELAKEYDFCISLGDGLRPGTIIDSTDWAQIQELLTISLLVKRARKANVQVMVEGPGHIPIHEVQSNVNIEKALCDGAPFYVLGPLVTDIAPGYDHIVAAIGGALAGMAGADYLCYVTPSEHLGLPTDENDIIEGVIASKIAAHAADLAKRKDEMNWDRKMSEARAQLNWDLQFQLAIDPEKATKYYNRNRTTQTGNEEPACTMCGKYCALKILAKELGDKKIKDLQCRF